MTAAVIVNPHAGGGAARRRWQAAAHLVEARLGRVETRFTEGPGHAAQLAVDLCRSGFDLLVAAGGDGTLNEVVDGALASGGAAVAVGVLPLGCGGDFARTLGLRGLRHAVEVLAAGRTRPVDVARASFRDPSGRIGGRHFVNVAGFGLAATAASAVQGWPRVVPGRIRYLSAAALDLFRSGGFHVRLAVDGGRPEEFHAATVAVANGQYQGCGIRIAPLACIDDGVLDITVVEHVGLLELAANLPLLYNGRIYGHPKVRRLRGCTLCAQAATPVPLELDGEPVGTLPLEVEVLPGALRFVCEA